MNRLIGRGVLAALLFLLAGAVASRPAQAQLSPAQKLEMKTHYEKATRAYDVGKYQEAIEEYQKAYEIGGDPPMLYNIAQAYRLNDQPADALRFYRRYLQRKPDARNREDVERKIAELEKVAEERKKAAAEAAAAASTAGAKPPAVSTSPPGSSSSSSSSSTSSPTGAAAGAGSSSGTAAGTATEKAPFAVGESPAPPPASAEPPSGRARLIVGLALIGAGVLAGGGAGIEAWRAKVRGDKLTSESAQKGQFIFDPAVEQNGKNADLAAMILTGVAGAAVIAGAVVLLTMHGGTETAAPPSPVASATVVPWLGAGLVGAGAELRF